MYALTIPAHLDALPVVSAFVWAVASDAKLSQAKAYRIRLAIDELVTNIIMHGYANCVGCPPIMMWAEFDTETISFTVEDGGKPFDLTSLPPPDVNAPLDTRELGGLGVFLVTRYIDSVRYEYVNGHNINRLTMTCDTC
jgi:serine/threonine-protein kinase RsbW